MSSLSKLRIAFRAGIAPLRPPLSARLALPSPEVGDRLMGVREPQQAQEPDQNNLAKDRKAVDEEGDGAANNGGLDQIKNTHTTVFKFCPGEQRLCARLLDEAAVQPSVTSTST